MFEATITERGRTVGDFVRLAKKHRGLKVYFATGDIRSIGIPAKTLAASFAADTGRFPEPAGQTLLTEVRSVNGEYRHLAICAPGDHLFQVWLDKFDAAEKPATEAKAA